MDKTDKEVIKILLIKQQEISNRFYETITEVMRLGYETDRGKAKVNDLSESVEYILSDMKRLLNRWKRSFVRNSKTLELSSVFLLCKFL